jgi:hypothetical protein
MATTNFKPTREHRKMQENRRKLRKEMRRKQKTEKGNRSRDRWED